MQRRFYVHGETIPGKTPIRGSDSHATIEDALEEARMRQSLRGAIVEIYDQDEKLIMSADEVQQALKAPKSN